jgi:hypothetical protein
LQAEILEAVVMNAVLERRLFGGSLLETLEQ